MTKKELIRELELLADSCDSNYALEMNGYNRGVLDALSVVNQYFALANTKRMLIDFCQSVQCYDIQQGTKGIKEGVEDYLESINFS